MRMYMTFIGFILLALACSKDKENETDTVSENTNLPTMVSSKDYFLNLEITNIKDIEGNVNYAIYDSQQDYDNENNWVIADKISVSNDTMRIQFKNLSTGDYVISLYHDKNANDKLDKNLLGIPTEGFGFSNNAMGTFGPPSFDQAKIHIDSLVDQNTSISLRYF